MTITVEKMPRKWPSEQYEADLPNAPAWATHAKTFLSGSMTEPESYGDLRTWVLPVGEYGWDAGEFFGEEDAQATIELHEVSREDGTVSPYPIALTVDVPSSGLDFMRPEEAREFAALILRGADALERILTEEARS